MVVTLGCYWQFVHVVWFGLCIVVVVVVIGCLVVFVACCFGRWVVFIDYVMCVVSRFWLGLVCETLLSLLVVWLRCFVLFGLICVLLLLLLVLFRGVCFGL